MSRAAAGTVTAALRSAALSTALLSASAASAAPSGAFEPGGLHDAVVSQSVASDPASVASGLGRHGPEWLFWTVAGLDDARDLCCFGNNFRARGCSLARERQSWGTSSDFHGTGPSELLLFVEVAQGEPKRLVVAGASCPVDGGGRTVVALDGVDPAKSLDLLEGLARLRDAGRAHSESSDLSERALAALGDHAGDDAGRRLARLAGDGSVGLELRKNALFWAGQTRPELGVELADRILAGERGTELREQALFVLSQAEAPSAATRLRRAAESDANPETRSKALFWLSQIDAPEAPAWIYAAVGSEPDSEVREQAVFALSQIEGGTTYLIRLLRESEHADVKRQALFWLGQSDDPRALDELESLLEK